MQSTSLFYHRDACLEPRGTCGSRSREARRLGRVAGVAVLTAAAAKSSTHRGSRRAEPPALSAFSHGRGPRYKPHAARPAGAGDRAGEPPNRRRARPEEPAAAARDTGLPPGSAAHGRHLPPPGTSRCLPKPLALGLILSANSFWSGDVPLKPRRAPAAAPSQGDRAGEPRAPRGRRPPARLAALLPARLIQPPGLPQRRAPRTCPFLGSRVPFPSKQHHFPCGPR